MGDSELHLLPHLDEGNGCGSLRAECSNLDSRDYWGCDYDNGWDFLVLENLEVGRLSKRQNKGGDDPVLGVRVEGWFDKWVRQMVALYNYREDKAIKKSDFIRSMLSKAAPIVIEEFKKKYPDVKVPLPGREMGALMDFGRWANNERYRRNNKK